MTNQLKWPGRTIDAEFDGAATWRDAGAPYLAPTKPNWRRPWIVGIGAPLAGAMMFALGALIGLPGSSFAQSEMWQPSATAPGTAPPADALITGTEAGLALYSCRATVGSTLLIGRFRSDFGGCHIGLNGKEVEIKPFTLFSAPWQEGSEAAGAGALVAGQIVPDLAAPAVSSIVFPCRAIYQNAVHPGYVSERDHTCRFGFGGRVVTSEHFSVLQGEPWLTWVSAVAENIPDGTLIGGQEGGEPLYVCRAQDAHGVISGKLNREALGCSIASDGVEKVVKRFEVLIPRWAVSAGGGVPIGAVPSGRDASGLLYLCRGRSRATVQPGRLNESLRGCDIGMEGGEVLLQDYEVLTE